MNTLLGSTAQPSAVSLAPQRSASLLSAYGTLTKFRLNAMVLMTTSVGYLLAPADEFRWNRFLWTMLGTALAACSASAFNQMMEVNGDRLMARTRSRPLPSGALSMGHALIIATLTGYLGVAVLALFANLPAAGLALATILIYTLLYTPMKVRTTVNTLVGAVCGALPPLIGWVAAGGPLTPGSLVLPAVLFVWQIPHFFALAWLYRADYQRGGFKMLPVLDPAGRLTAQVSVLTSLLLVPVCLLGTLLGVAGLIAALCSCVLGLMMTMMALQFLKERSDRNARLLFIASISYMPLLLLVLAIDSGPLAPVIIHR